MRLLVPALLAFSIPALAGSPLDKYAGSIARASMEGDRVDVPLYYGPYGSTAPHVKVTIGDDEYLMALGTGHPGIFVSERVAKEQELKIKTGNKKFLNLKGKKGKFRNGGEQKNASLSEMKIGGLTLTDLNVSTVEIDKKAGGAAQGGHSYARDQKSGFAVDGEISLDSLPAGISWAVLPSQGVVSFSGNGQDLIADGSAIPYETVESGVLQIGRSYDTKALLPGTTLIQGFSVGGVEMPGTLKIGFAGSHQTWPDVVPTEIRSRFGDISHGYYEVSHGALSLGSTSVAEYTSVASHVSVSNNGLDFMDRVVVGQDLLAGFDIAADRTAKTFIVKKADQVKRESPLSFMIAQVQKTIDSADEAEPSAEDAAATESTEATAEEAEPEVAGTAKDWGTLLELHRAAGDLDSAIEAGKNAVVLDDNDCTEWSRLGSAYRDAGAIGEAIVAYEKSASIYHGWYDMPLEERKEIQKELDKLEGEEKENSAYKVAASSCHKADGDLAELTFAAGDLRTVGDIYRDRMDLDTTVALAAGTALVVQGQFDEAQGPLRQALKQGRGNQAMTRLALAGAYTGKGDWATASKLLERVLETNMGVQTVIYCLDALASNEDHAAAVAAALATVSQNPEVAGAVYGLGHVALQGDDEALQMATKEAGDRWFAAKMAVVPHNAYYAGVRARWMTLWDASSLASQKAVRGALSKDPANTDALLAKAAVHTAKGEAEAADKATMKAIQLKITHLGYAELMSTLSR